jgi:hypothetical protein
MKSRASIGLVLAMLLSACGGGGGADAGRGPGGAAAPAFTVGGIVSGLNGSTLVISNNGTDTLTLTSAGAFAFATALPEAATYDVGVVSQPSNPAQVCTVANGSGRINGGNVTDVQITCVGPLALLSAAPADGEPGVARTIQPQLRFSAALDAATAVAGSFDLRSAAGTQATSPVANSDLVTLTPSNVLLPLTDYTLTVRTDLRGSGGERLPNPVTVAFTTRDGAWQPEIEPHPAFASTAGSAVEPQIAFDANGHALLVWVQTSGARHLLWSSVHQPGTGWSPPVRVDRNVGDFFVAGPRIGFDGNGNAVAIWLQAQQGVNDLDVWASRHDPASGWGAPMRIDAGAGVADFPDLAAHPSGDAIAVWVKRDASAHDIWSSRFSAAGGWSPAHLLEAEPGPAGEPRVAFDAAGNAIAVWAQSEGLLHRPIWGRRYVAGSGWGAPLKLSTAINGVGGSPQIAVGADGDAVAIWGWRDGTTRDIEASRYSGSGGGWDTPVRVNTTGTRNTELPQIALGRDGSALAVWTQFEPVGGGAEPTVFANRYEPASGWSASAQISRPLQGGIAPRVAIDRSGHALAAWTELDLTLGSSGYAIWSNRYTQGAGWSAAQRIGATGSFVNSFHLNLAVDASGSAFAVWPRGGRVYANRFE